MLVLSRLGCQLFELFGFINIDGCSSLNPANNQSLNPANNQELSSFVWLKLLFVPTLGLLILTLFVLEDHCFGYEKNELEQKHRLDSINLSINQSNNQLNPFHHQSAHHSTNHVQTHRSRSSSNENIKHCNCHSQGQSINQTFSQSMQSLNSISRMPFSNGHITSLHQSLGHSLNQSPHVLLITDSHPDHESTSYSSLSQSIDQSIKATAYTMPLSFTLKDLISAHSQRHNQLLDPVRIWIDGRLLNQSNNQSINQTMEQLNVVDGSIIRVETDWKRLIECMQIEDDRSISQLRSTIQSTRKTRIEQQQIDKSLHQTISQSNGHPNSHLLTQTNNQSLSQFNNQLVNQSNNQLITQSIEEANALSEYQAAESHHQSINQAIDRLRADLIAAQSRYAQSEQDLLNCPQSIEQSLNQSIIKKLESRIEELKTSIEQSATQSSDLITKQSKLDEEIADLEVKSANQLIKLNRLVAEKEVWHKKITDDVTSQKLASVEKARENFARVKNIFDESEREVEEKRTMKQDLHRSINQAIIQFDREINKSNAAVTALESEYASLQSIKQSIKSSESALKVNQSLKQSIKQSKTREKMLDKELKELINWRQRAKAFEREVKMLRTWRRECGRRERERDQTTSLLNNQTTNSLLKGTDANLQLLNQLNSVSSANLQSLNQLTSQLNNQSISQLTSQSLSQLTSQTLSQLSSQLSSSMNNHSINQLSHQLNNQLNNQLSQSLQLPDGSAIQPVDQSLDLDDFVDGSVYDDYDHSINQSIGCSINPSNHHWTPSQSDSDEAAIPPVLQSINQSISQSINQSNHLSDFDFDRLAQLSSQLSNLSSTLQPTATPFIPGVFDRSINQLNNQQDQSSPRATGFW